MGVARRGWPALVLTLLGVIPIACGPSATPSPVPGTPAQSQAAATTSSPAAIPTDMPSPTITPDLSGRPFTVLVLGGDLGFRTDSIIVVGVDPTRHSLALASIPRDTIDVPLPGGGTFTNQKINAFWDAAARDTAHYPQGPGRATADMVGALLGIKVDFYAATTFDGFRNLVAAMGKVSITLPAPVVDPYYQVTSTQIGVSFPAGAQQLTPDRALIFVRTRQGDNDFERARRQQLFLLAAGRQLAANPELLPLLVAAQSNLVTDFPLAELPTLLAVFGSSQLTVQQAVLGPTRYEATGPCPCGYALVPNVPAMRALAASFYPWAVAAP